MGLTLVAQAVRVRSMLPHRAGSCARALKKSGRLIPRREAQPWTVLGAHGWPTKKNYTYSEVLGPQSLPPTAPWPTGRPRAVEGVGARAWHNSALQRTRIQYGGEPLSMHASSSQPCDERFGQQCTTLRRPPSRRAHHAGQ